MYIQTLQNCLDLFTVVDRFEGHNQYFCEECNSKVNATSQCVLLKLPKYLIIQLSRFDYDYNTFSFTKVYINIIISFSFYSASFSSYNYYYIVK